jgi:hypothetical protein
LQIAAYLKEKCFQNVQVHHEGDADVTSELNELTYAFEYERGRTHTLNQIIDKNSRAKLLYDVVFFVCLQSNERTVKKAVGAPNCRPRGFKFKDLIDSVAEGKFITEHQPTELKEPIISKIEAT